MTTKNIGRAAEHLVCAELSRRRMIASTFTHNVPLYDILVGDTLGRTTSIQVKGSSSESWTFQANELMVVEFDSESKTQKVVSNLPCEFPNLIWVCVVVRSPDERQENLQDRFFILTGKEIHDICCNNYREYLSKCKGQRKRNWQSMQYFWNTDDLKQYENNWSLISDWLEIGPLHQVQPAH